MDFKSLEANRLLEMLFSYGFSIFGAITVLIVGFWLGRLISKYIYALMLKRELEPSIRIFLKDILNITLNIMVILVTINTMGVEITSILAVLGAGALGVGMGLQGGLSNFAAGIMIILTKPFKVGDLIEAGTHIGYVEKINILNTTISSPRNELIILPNAPLFNNPLSNFSTKEFYRIDISVGIEYKTDIKKLKPLIKEAIKKNELFLKDKPLTIEIEEFAEDRIKLTVRAFINPKNYWEAPLRLNEIVNDTIEENGFVIPIAQRQIQIIHKK